MLLSVDRPPLQDRSERLGVQVMDFRAPYPMRANQVRIFEDGQVLGDGLPGRGVAVLHRQPGADIEQRQIVSLNQLIKNLASGAVCQRSEDISHAHSIGK